MLKGNRRNFFDCFFMYIPVILRLEGPVFVTVMSHIGFVRLRVKHCLVDCASMHYVPP